jgi:hypothetical protein
MSARKAGSIHSTLSTGGSTQRHRRALVDRMLDEYISWREECSCVAFSHARWNRAASHERSLAFGAYVAALDREERAATVYRELIDRLAAAQGTAG